jgi:hypothetical protein
MSNGMGPPLPLGSHPNSIDITDPKYAFIIEDWIKTLGQFDHAITSKSPMIRRKENDHAYQQVGNVSTLKKYITFGYHVYDHCFQFKTQWEKMRENEVDALTFIWYMCFYHVNRALDIPTKLERWAIDIAHPYLLNITYLTSTQTFCCHNHFIWIPRLHHPPGPRQRNLPIWRIHHHDNWEPCTNVARGTYQGSNWFGTMEWTHPLRKVKHIPLHPHCIQSLLRINWDLAHWQHIHL